MHSWHGWLTALIGGWEKEKYSWGLKNKKSDTQFHLINVHGGPANFRTGAAPLEKLVLEQQSMYVCVCTCAHVCTHIHTLHCRVTCPRICLSSIVGLTIVSCVERHVCVCVCACGCAHTHTRFTAESHALVFVSVVQWVQLLSVLWSGLQACTLRRLRGPPTRPQDLAELALTVMAPSLLLFVQGLTEARLVGISSDLEFCHPANTS